jgi:hypothetical protein
MKLHKHLHEMTELEAFECLQGAAIAIIKGDYLPEEVRRWIGYGLLGMCAGTDFNKSFVVKRVKKQSVKTHAMRFAEVEILRKAGNNKSTAIKIIADKNYVTEDAIFDSWKIQKIIQDKINLNNKD